MKVEVEISDIKRVRELLLRVVRNEDPDNRHFNEAFVKVSKMLFLPPVKSGSSNDGDPYNTDEEWLSQTSQGKKSFNEMK